MKIEEIHRVLNKALAERIKSRVCLINDSVGNIYKYKDKLYIITCKHVADNLFYKKEQYILLHGNERISSKDLRYITSTTDIYDIALIQILNTNSIKDFYEESDLNIIQNYNEYDFRNSVFFILGFPSQLVFYKEAKEFLLWMSYMTTLSKEESSDDNFIYLKYERDSEHNFLNDKNITTKLPLAPGLSGSFIFKIDRPNDNKIWYPSSSRAIAIQTSWNKKSWLKGSNLIKLIDLFKSID